MSQILHKSLIKTHTRKTKSGKLAVVPQHTDKRTKKAKPLAKEGRTFVDKGEKIGGARKDLWSDILKGLRRMDLSDLEGMDSATARKAVAKDKIFYDMAEYLKGKKVDPGAAFLSLKVFGMVGAKPGDSDQERKQYMVGSQRLFAMLSGAKTVKDVLDVVSDLRSETREGLLTPAGRKAKLAYQTKYNEWQLKREKKWKELITRDGYTRKGAKPQTQTAFHEWERKNKPDFVEAANARRKHLEKSLDKALADPMSLKNCVPTMGERFVGFVSMRGKSTVDTFNKHAVEAAKIKDWAWADSTGLTPKVSRKVTQRWSRQVPEEVELKGGSRKKFKPETLIEEFKVRGVEYGNWVDEDSARHHTQMLGLALIDLSDVLEIKPEQVSLKGRLALAFGARGTGMAAAHYESSRKVINLTKYGGGGSLAHEWGHFVDNIVQMQGHDGKVKHSYMSDTTSQRSKIQGQPVGPYGPKTHPDVVAASNDLWVAMTEGSYGGKRSNKTENRYRNYGMVDTVIDSTSSPQAAMTKLEGEKDFRGKPRFTPKALKVVADYIHTKTGTEVRYGGASSAFALGSKQHGEYWNRPHEMFARAFECYVNDKMISMKRRNTYLVSGVSDKGIAEWANFKEETFAPYPFGEERVKINAAMEKLVGAMRKHKVLQKSVALLEGEELLQKATAGIHLLRKAARELQGRTVFQGLPISIENRRGSIRQWFDEHTQKEGMTRMAIPYGYIRGTLGVDGDQVDCFVGPSQDAIKAYVIHIRKAPDFTTYDEDKVMLGFKTATEALKVFRKHYDKPGFYGGMTTLPMDRLKEVLATTRTNPRKLTA